MRGALLAIAAAAALGFGAASASAGVNLNFGFYPPAPVYGGYYPPPPVYEDDGYDYRPRHCSRVFAGYRSYWDGYGWAKEPVYKRRCGRYSRYGSY